MPTTVYHFGFTKARSARNQFDLMLTPAPDRFSMINQIRRGIISFSPVAVVPGTLDYVFMSTNSIDRHWWENAGVHPLFTTGGCRSTSVGDILGVDNTKFFIVDGVGFQPFDYNIWHHAAVFKVLNAAASEGFEPLAMRQITAVMVCREFLTYEKSLDGEEPKLLIPHIEDWLCQQAYKNT